MPAPLALLPSPKAKEPPSSRSCSVVSLTSEGWWRKEEGREASEAGKLVLSVQAAQPLPGPLLLRSSGMKCLLS